MGIFNQQDEAYMRRAIELARNGEGRVSPNPPVGCVIVNNGRIVGEGWHDRLGDLHAEAMALRQAGKAARDADVYVTLSPCTSHGRQPPCSEALIRASVGRVFVSASDPNPGNANGVEMLNAAGIPTAAGLLQEEGEYAARGFFKKMRRGLPWLTLKFAMTMDGRVASASGDSRWVSGPESREVVQDMRSRHDAVMVGSGTALGDNPLLNVRDPIWSQRGGDEKHRQPLRVVADSRCRLPADAAMLDSRRGPGGQVVVACARGADQGRSILLRRAGADVLELPSHDDRVPLEALLRELVGRGINQVLCESGGELSASLLNGGLVDEIVGFVAPKIIGGRNAPGPVGGHGIERMVNAIPLVLKECIRIGDDILIRSLVPGSA